jgi:hypothetical protein
MGTDIALQKRIAVFQGRLLGGFGVVHHNPELFSEDPDIRLYHSTVTTSLRLVGLSVYQKLVGNGAGFVFPGNA